MRYQRSQTPGATYFFTVVTHERKRVLCLDENPRLLGHALETVKAKYPMIVDAIVLLPDHLHCLWTLPPGDSDYSKRWMLIKSHFTRVCHDPFESRQISSRIAKRERYIWQRRFWEHQIRDDMDFMRHVEYIHYNPVKHGWTAAPSEWKYTSFHRYVKEGKYAVDWGANEVVSFDDMTGRE
jgi:putative transposase